jgi:hypothetical protein
VIEVAEIPVRVASSGETSATGTVTVKDGANTLDTVTLGDDGAGTATIPALALPVGTYTLTLDYSGDDAFAPASGTVTLTVTKATSVTEATAVQTSVQVKKNHSRFTVEVGAPGYTPTGTVRVTIDGGSTFSGTLVDGVASILVGPWMTVGSFDTEVTYLGDANTLPSTDSVRITVIKQTPTLTVSAPDSVKKGAKPTIKVKVSGTGGTVTGRVQFSYNGGAAVQWLNDGATSRTLAALTKSTTVKVTYLGNGSYESVSRSVTIRVVS